MPRLPVDGKKVIEHRITIGTKERQLVEEVVNAQSFNKIAEPIVAGLSDVSFMLTVGAILTIWFPSIVLPALEDATTGKIVEAIQKGVIKDPSWAQEQALSGAPLPAVFGIRFGSWLTDLVKALPGVQTDLRGEQHQGEI